MTTTAPPCRIGHATHPDWRMALSMACAQADGPGDHGLGICYFSDHYADDAAALLEALQARWPGCRWVGCAAAGIAATGVEYIDEPALALMRVPVAADDFQIFHGQAPLTAGRHAAALVHADPALPDLEELLAELAGRLQTGYLFGGLMSSRRARVQWAGTSFEGGLSGVAFAPQVRLLSRITQGCQPIGAARAITRSQENVVLELDGEPALPVLLRDIGADPRAPRAAIARLQAVLAGLGGGYGSFADGGPATRRGAPGDAFDATTRVRPIVGIDPAAHAIAIGTAVEDGMTMTFCTRDAQTARKDLVRACSEIRSAVEPDDGADAAAVRHLGGGIYVSCAGRTGRHFGADSAELQIVRHALGDVPLVGFFAAGEIARHDVYGFTGVLTAFVADGPST